MIKAPNTHKKSVLNGKTAFFIKQVHEFIARYKVPCLCGILCPAYVEFSQCADSHLANMKDNSNFLIHNDLEW